MQACYLRAFLPKLEEWNAERARIAALYDEAFAGSSTVRPLARRRVRSAICTWCGPAVATRLRKFLSGHGIMTGVHYPVPLHLQPAFQDFGGKRGAFPIAERACREILSLPLWPYMPESAVQEVAGRVLEWPGK